MSEATIHDILAQFRDEELHNRHLGDRFERLICRYLELDPQYSERFSNVWLWNEWPRKGEVGDIGIDIVAEEEATGDIVGIQCKFYLPDHQLSKGDIDKFLALLGKKQFASGIIVSTTDKWGPNVEHTIKDQSKPIQKLRVQDLDASPVDWSTFSLEAINKLKLQKKRKPRPHSRAALDDVKAGFEAYDRGKLIMACGTGKTYTSLCLAEEIALGGNVLFLVPSLALLSQALREWTAHSAKPIHALAVCSDANIGRRKEKDGDDNPDIDVTDLAFPATTDTKSLVRQWEALQRKIKNRKQSKENRGTTVIFSTYHSIETIKKAQKAGLPDFDLVICDEAHRTTGVTLSDDPEESHFVKIHDNENIRAVKRLYMTATPRVYGDEAKSKAGEADATLCSMDDEAIFGPEFHRLGFGEAVERNLLSDYKVLVLAVDESYAARTFQKQITDSDNSLNLDDAVRITGCWNGLAKKLDHTTTDEAELFGDLAPMRTAVAFSRSIANSKAFCDYFTELVAAYKTDHPDEENLLDIECDHVDGGMNAITRSQKLDWLKEPGPALRCRILSNARCLSEGVDVPSLDAVMFLNPRNSVVDVVQSVGRVMRKATNKQYGYIILPIGIPAGISPEEALKDNKKYAVVWQVLQALRSHDDRFNATINQIELNKKPPARIGVIGVGGNGGDGDGNDGSKSDGDGKDKLNDKKKGGQGTFDFFQNLQEWKDALYARIVKKCGERRPWEKWSEDIASIAQRHIDRLNLLLDKDPDIKVVNAFAKFIAGLHRNINPAITREEAIEMLAQHLITKPVFDALFENYAFSEHNPVSKAMQTMADVLQGQALEKETETLEKFYASVRTRAEGIDNAEGKQTIILELYNRFFATAFKKTHDRLGIVYTPVPIVDFIIHSVEDVLRQEFQSSLTAQDVHIIDPFTGTGTFITRLLQSGLIKPEDLHRKFTQELHANEIVLLAYYIAAINIEETFHTLQLEAHHARYEGKEKGPEPLGYITFDGIVLTDTFQLTEAESSQSDMEDAMFPVNNKRVTRQKKAPIRVVIANPPYSVNDNPVPYPTLDARITETYAARSTATNKNSLYDSYIRAIRWASDRIGKQGVVGFVTNGYFIDANVCDGFRSCLVDEFTSLYIFNLRGNARTSGEQRRMEKDNVFAQGSRTPVAISILVRNPDKPTPGELFYHDIGDYLSREEKLGIVATFTSLNGLHRDKKWRKLKPNAEADWINHRDPAFDKFTPIGDKEETLLTFFARFSRGVATSRDTWAYNFSRDNLSANITRHVENYNEDTSKFHKALETASKASLELPSLESVVPDDPRRLHWSRGVKQDATRGRVYSFSETRIYPSHYRPFTKSNLYFDSRLNDMIYRLPSLFPTSSHENVLICTTSPGNRLGFSLFISDCIPDLHMADGSGATQCFPLYLYEKAEAKDDELDLSDGDDGGDGGEIVDGYRRKPAITDGILAEFRKAYGKGVSKEDIFYYVYGILHSPEYHERFAADLKKMLPRIPLTQETKDFKAFTQAGRDLAHWHLNYETIDPHPAVYEETGDLGLNPWELYQVRKMTFARPTAAQKAAGEKWDKTRIIYNSKLTLTGIPLDAYDYIVNGKPALEWIMERYQLSKDPKSGITNDPNDWCKEPNNPRYIVDLIKRVTRVSLETMKIVYSLPALNERRDG